VLSIVEGSVSYGALKSYAGPSTPLVARDFASNNVFQRNLVVCKELTFRKNDLKPSGAEDIMDGGGSDVVARDCISGCETGFSAIGDILRRSDFPFPCCFFPILTNFRGLTKDFVMRLEKNWHIGRLKNGPERRTRKDVFSTRQRIRLVELTD
jgi:hypothetical protein